MLSGSPLKRPMSFLYRTDFLPMRIFSWTKQVYILLNSPQGSQIWLQSFTYEKATSFYNSQYAWELLSEFCNNICKFSKLAKFEQKLDNFFRLKWRFWCIHRYQVSLVDICDLKFYKGSKITPGQVLQNVLKYDGKWITLPFSRLTAERSLLSSTSESFFGRINSLFHNSAFHRLQDRPRNDRNCRKHKSDRCDILWCSSTSLCHLKSDTHA